MSIFRGSLRLNDDKDELLLFLSRAMPDDIRDELQDIISLGFGSSDPNTSSDTPGYDYGALHFSYYNRYHTHVSLFCLFVLI
jgi:hypothetical protein